MSLANGFELQSEEAERDLLLPGPQVKVWELLLRPFCTLSHSVICAHCSPCSAPEQKLLLHLFLASEPVAPRSAHRFKSDPLESPSSTCPSRITFLEPERGLRIKLYVLQGLPGFTVSVSSNIKGTWEVRSGKLRPSRVQQGKTKTRCVFPSNLGKGASEAGAIARGGTRVGREVISRIQGKTRRGKRHTESDWRRRDF